MKENLIIQMTRKPSSKLIGSQILSAHKLQSNKIMLLLLEVKRHRKMAHRRDPSKPMAFNKSHGIVEHHPIREGIVSSGHQTKTKVVEEHGDEIEECQSTTRGALHVDEHLDWEQEGCDDGRP